ncbi:MAG: TIGR03435 family protein [Planctomycetota bacterium]
MPRNLVIVASMVAALGAGMGRSAAEPQKKVTPGSKDFEPSRGTSLVVGQTVPPLKFAKTLRSPGYEAATLKTEGKPLALFFWAPGNEGSRHAINLLNALATVFGSEEVLLIGVTRDNEGLVRISLAKQPVQDWIALDLDGSVTRAFDAELMPHLVLVDRQGKVAAIGDPRDLTENTLRNLVSGIKVGLPAKKIPMVAPEKVKIDPLYEVVIARSDAEPMSYRFKLDSAKGHYSGEAVPMPQMVALAYKARMSRMVFLHDVAMERYRFSIRHPSKDEEKLQELFQQAVSDALGIECEYRKAEANVLRLRRLKEAVEPLVDDSEPGRELIVLGATGGEGVLRKARPNQKLGGNAVAPGTGLISLKGTTMKGFARSLEDQLGVPVINETEMTGDYNMRLSADLANETSVAKGLRDMGLELVKDKGTIQVLVVDKKK